MVVLTMNEITVDGKPVMTKDNAFSNVLYFKKERDENGGKPAKCLKMKIETSKKWNLLQMSILGQLTFYEKDEEWWKTLEFDENDNAI